MATSPYGNLMNLRSITGPAGGTLGGASAGGGFPIAHPVGPQPGGGMQSGWGGMPYAPAGGMQPPGAGMGGYGGGVVPFHSVGPQSVSPYPIMGGGNSPWGGSPVQGNMGGYNLGGNMGGFGHPVGPQQTPGGPFGANAGGPGFRAVGPSPFGGQNYENLLMLSRMGY